MIITYDRAKAIRVKCLDCCCDSHAEVRKCHITECALWPFRIGSGYIDPNSGKEYPNRLTATENGIKKED